MVWKGWSVRGGETPQELPEGLREIVGLSNPNSQLDLKHHQDLVGEGRTSEIEDSNNP